MAEQNATNARFFQVNLAGVEDKDRVFAGIPLADDSIDLFVNRRGPILARYLAEALRVARRGAVIVGLHPPDMRLRLGATNYQNRTRKHSWCCHLTK